jgi:tRNA dimethylallyltransferase
MRHLVVIVGPTGVGKSRLGLELAGEFSGEIVGADSRQVYRHMDIGTAKPSLEEQSLVRHHVFDIINPDEDFSLARYQHLACEAIDDVHQRGQLPFLVGGSGLYVWAVVEGWRIPHVPPDTVFRREMEKRAAEIGGHNLYEELVGIDPVAAHRIDPRNVRRVIRALEISHSNSLPVSELRDKQAPSYESLIIGLTTDRSELYRRIDTRVEAMIERGLIDEVKKLVEMGYDSAPPVVSGIGYRQITMYLRGELSLDETLQQIKTGTHRLARHQYSWFRLKDERIHWFDVRGEVEPEIRNLVAKVMEGG